ncbi:MAG: cation/H(+) antiporter, partial [Tannerellaceae bacterium]
TTFMTTPLVSFINFCFRTREKIKEYKHSEPTEGVFKILLSFGRASNGQVMLDVAHQMFSRNKNKLELTALHLTVGTDVNPLHTDNFEEVSFGPILYGAQKLGVSIFTRYEVSNNASQDICNIVNNEGFDFLLVGAGISMSDLPSDIDANRYRTSFYNKYFKHFKAPESWFYPGALLKDKTKQFIEQADCAVGVFVNRGFVKATSVILIIESETDLYLLPYARTLLKATHGSIGIVNKSSTTTPGRESIQTALQQFAAEIAQATILPNKDLTPELFNGYNFMLISYHTWNDVSDHRKEALQRMPSTLILSK